MAVRLVETDNISNFFNLLISKAEQENKDISVITIFKELKSNLEKILDCFPEATVENLFTEAMLQQVIDNLEIVEESGKLVIRSKNKETE